MPKIDKNLLILTIKHTIFNQWIYFGLILETLLPPQFTPFIRIFCWAMGFYWAYQREANNL